MSKIDKVIKDLKERNDKLLEQYRYRDFRCITLEQRLEQLQQELNQKNKIIEELKEYVDYQLKENKNLEQRLAFSLLKTIYLKKFEELEKRKY